MARPLSTEQKTATEAAKTLAETRERKAHMDKANGIAPTNPSSDQPHWGSCAQKMGA